MLGSEKRFSSTLAACNELIIILILVRLLGSETQYNAALPTVNSADSQNGIRYEFKVSLRTSVKVFRAVILWLSHSFRQLLLFRTSVWRFVIRIVDLSWRTGRHMLMLHTVSRVI